MRLVVFDTLASMPPPIPLDDGVASPFYNHADLLGDVANAFDEFSETNIATKFAQ